MKLAANVSEQTYKVVVWATGRVGKLAIRAIADRPNLELAGVWVHSQAKDGQDAGTLAGIQPLGVAATPDPRQRCRPRRRRRLRVLHWAGHQPPS
jgi:dihydrodipicolinate reductase